MYSPQLEELIDAILADGEVSTKELEILRRRAKAEGEDPDEVEIIVLGRLAKKKNTAASVAPASAPVPPIPAEPASVKPASNKYGDIQKCPNCGAVREPGNAKCLDCGYAYTNIEANRSVKLLSEKIMQIESEYAEDGGMVSFFVKAMSPGQDARTKRICNAITTFPVPSAKDDLIEFILFTKSKMKWNRSTDDMSQRSIARAYDQKYDELVEKARAFFGDDPQVMELVKEKKKNSFSIFGRK